MNTIILIPPSEGKTTGGEYPPITPTKEQLEIISRLQSFDGDQQKLLGVKDKVLDEAIKANNTILKQKTLPAIKRYSGVVYDGFDFQSLNKSQQEFANKHIYVISALFGLVNIQNNIPNYKLKIKKLQAAQFWKEHIDLEKYFVIDLLPNEHRKAISYDNGIQINFSILKNGKKIPAGHNGKFIKGRFLRYLCEQKKVDINTIKKFNEDSFKWNGKEFVKKI